MNRLFCAKNAGFTLLELLTVIAIIGIFIGLLFSALSGAKMTAKKKQAEVEAESIAMAVRAYYLDFHKWPGDPDGDRTWSNDNHFVISDLVSNGRKVYIERTALGSPYCDPFGGGTNAYRIFITNNTIYVWSMGVNGADDNRKSDDIVKSN